MRHWVGACVLVLVVTLGPSNTLFGASPIWSQLSTSGTAPSPRYGHTAVYDPVSNRMIVFGGRKGGPNDPQANTAVFDDLWILTNANGTGGPSQWLNVTPPSGPPPTWGHSAVFDDVSNTMVVFGGVNGFNSPCSCDVWYLANANGVSAAPAWTKLPVSCRGPGPRQMMISAFNHDTTSMLLVGGSNCTNDNFTDVSEIANATIMGQQQSWISLNPGGTSLPSTLRITGTSAYDEANDRLIIWGANFAYPLNQLYMLDDAGGRTTRPLAWSILTLSSAPSSAANGGQVAVYNANANRALFFGGVVPGNGFPQLTGTTNETWRLDNANGLNGTPSWSRVTFAGAVPSPRTMNSAVYDAGNDRMIVFGGGADGGTTSNNDVWILSNATASSDGGGSSPLQLTPSSLSFSDTVVGTTSPSLNTSLVNVTTCCNDSTQTVPITITVTGDFTQTNTCGSTMQPSQSCVIQVAFAPTATGVRTGVLTITPASPFQPLTMALSGTGTGPNSLSTAFTINGVPNSTTTPYTATPGQSLTFAATEPSNASFVWNFGDGASASGRTAQHAYTSTGVYTASLAVSENGVGFTGIGKIAVASSAVTAVHRRSASPPNVVLETLTTTLSLLTFRGTAGGTSPASQSIRIGTTSGHPIPFTVAIANGSTWLSVSPLSGMTPATITVIVNSSGVGARTWSDSLRITSNAPVVAVPVALQLDSPPPPWFTNGASFSAPPTADANIVLPNGQTIAGTNQLIVAIKTSATNSDMQQVANILSGNGGKVVGEISDLRLLQVDMNQLSSATSLIRALQSSPAVDSVTVNQNSVLTVFCDSVPRDQWQQSDDLFQPASATSDVMIAVIDGMTAYEQDIQATHGDFVKAFAEEASFHRVPVVTKDLGANTSWFDQAMQMVLLLHDNPGKKIVFNLSLGAASGEREAAYYDYLAEFVGRASQIYGNRFIIVKSAGNNQVTVNKPQLACGLITVGALDQNASGVAKPVPSFTQGSGVSVFAPGCGVTPNASYTHPGAGTSYAAPQVTGQIASVWAAHPDLDRCRLQDAVYGLPADSNGVRRFDGKAVERAAATTPQTTLTVKLAGFPDSLTGESAVVSQDGAIDCLPSCTTAYPKNTPVTLAADYGEDYEFVGWSGDCAGTATTCGFTMDRDRIVTATYRVASFSVTPASLNLSAAQGTSPAAQLFTASNLSGVPIVLMIDTSADWMSGPIDVSVAPHGTATFTITFDTR